MFIQSIVSANNLQYHLLAPPGWFVFKKNTQILSNIYKNQQIQNSYTRTTAYTEVALGLNKEN